MITMDKKYKTRDGQDVRVLCVDAAGFWPVVALIDGGVSRFKSNGRYGGDEEHALDLIELPAWNFCRRPTEDELK